MPRQVTFRGGRLPRDPYKLRIRLTDFVDVPAVAAQIDAGALPAAPAAVDWDRRVSGWGMLGNADWGDCFWAMCYHALQAMTANAGVELVPTTQDTLRGYAEGTGFDPYAGPPGRNPTDRGTVLQDGLAYWRRTGLPVTTRTGTVRHRILAFFEVDHRDPAQVRVAAALFGGGLWGINFPQSGEDQFNAGEPWSYVPGSPVVGGHAVYEGRYGVGGVHWPITWGQEQPTEQSFVDRYLDECWGVIAPEWADAAGSTPAGVDLYRLGEIIAEVTGDPNPIPGPDQPPGPPPLPPGLDPAALAAVQALVGDPQVARWAGRRHAGDTAHAAARVRDVIASWPR